MYAIKTVDNKIAMDTRTGQLEIYETFDYACNAICREQSSVDFREGYNKGRRDMALESLGILVFGAIVGWLIL